MRDNIRKSHNARFCDQKCTPDVVCFIADCINNIASGDSLGFDTNTIWTSQYFIKNTRAIFNKPWANDIRAKHEYDKFIAQPLKLLSYAHIIEQIGDTKKNIYVVNNQLLLDYIAQRLTQIIRLKILIVIIN